MPGGDRTGPMGMGPMTGRGAGFCAGFGAPGYANPVFGYGRGVGRGMGRGRRFGRGRGLGRGWWRGGPGAPAGGWTPVGAANPWAPPSPDQELEALKAQAGAMQRSLDQINGQIETLTRQSEADG